MSARKKTNSNLMNLDYINSRYNKLELDKKIGQVVDALVVIFSKIIIALILSLAVNQKLLAMPLKFIQTAVAPKAKAGRPAKAKECLARQ
ncbi:hypothetical protein BpHYR1_043081 [Brachionus plicatilis]|uniref:Uncharacterized protein n=1 Tax=Brachionus plicatilis TaxID=10195 RepID=A0A3M7PGJ2_BRAPC|nr:hypothetical protein BpHYR1_043081 [Brachionus plicatilis]